MTQHIHILGICGTFMGSLAQLAKSLGYKVTGSDANVYPPMSSQLQDAGIALSEGFEPETLTPTPDLVIVGNVVSRGNPAMEEVLNRGIPYISGPQWLAENILHKKWVLAVSGTHGKTTTTSMLAWILEYAGFDPGFLIGGVPGNFSTSARVGESDFFVIEADEYDTAFFDKRAKFVHYRPRTLVLGNLEFDHADIYPDLTAIQTQFHHLLRTLPSDGLVISPLNSEPISTVYARGLWSNHQTTSLCGTHTEGDWHAHLNGADGSEFTVNLTTDASAENTGHVKWSLTGEHNVANAMHAIAAARHIGISPKTCATALCAFKGVKRRMEVVASNQNVTLYDDFAHHPTAIALTLDGLRKKVGAQKIIAVLEPRSNTMKMGVHNNKLNDCVALADTVYWFDQHGQSGFKAFLENLSHDQHVHHSMSELNKALQHDIQHADTITHIVLMSNGSFGGIHKTLRALIQP